MASVEYGGRGCLQCSQLGLISSIDIHRDWMFR